MGGVIHVCQPKYYVFCRVRIFFILTKTERILSLFLVLHLRISELVIKRLSTALEIQTRLFWNICSPILWITNFLNGRIWNRTNKSLVCARYCENVMTLMSFFCSLIKGSRYILAAFP